MNGSMALRLLVAGATAVPMEDGLNVLVTPADGPPSFVVNEIIFDDLVDAGFVDYEDGAYRVTQDGINQSNHGQPFKP